MKCPSCGAAELVHDTRDREYTYIGKSTMMSVTGDFCPVCDELIMDLTESNRISTLMLEFNKKIEALKKDVGIVACIPLSVEPELPKKATYSTYEQVKCPLCQQLMWLGHRSKEQVNQGAIMMCMICLSRVMVFFGVDSEVVQIENLKDKDI